MFQCFMIVKEIKQSIKCDSIWLQRATASQPFIITHFRLASDQDIYDIKLINKCNFFPQRLNYVA